MSYFIGIDPASRVSGYAVLNEKGELIEKGRIHSLADDPTSFHSMYEFYIELFHKYKPQAILCEQQFSGPNRNTMMKIIRPTGVVLAAAGSLPDVEFKFILPTSWRLVYHLDTPFTKKYSKKDSFEVTKLRFPDVLGSFNKDNDISDAIGLAYACWATYG